MPRPIISIFQKKEEYRGKSKHETCGVGIFETKVRNEEYRIESTISGFSNLSRQQLYFYKIMTDISCYKNPIHENVCTKLIINKYLFKN